jgi:hypothetical protein
MAAVGHELRTETTPPLTSSSPLREHPPSAATMAATAANFSMDGRYVITDISLKPLAARQTETCCGSAGHSVVNRLLICPPGGTQLRTNHP